MTEAERTRLSLLATWQAVQSGFPILEGVADRLRHDPDYLQSLPNGGKDILASIAGIAYLAILRQKAEDAIERLTEDTED